MPGFSAPDDKGNWTGLDVDVVAQLRQPCSTIRPRSNSFRCLPKTGLSPCNRGEIDVLSRNTTWTLSRDTSLGAVSPA